MRIFVPQPIHGGFLSQMTFLFPEAEWVLEGDKYNWSPTLTKAPTIIEELFNVGTLHYSGAILDDIDLTQFDLVLTVLETHFRNKKLREYKGPIIWRTYYSMLRGKASFNGPIVYASKFVKALSATPGEVIYETRDPDIYNSWVGNNECALIVAGNLKARHVACGGVILDKIRDAVPTEMVTGANPIDKAELLNLYQTCRVYVDAAPDVRKISYARVFSGSFIEAMMCGAPTVVTNTNEFGLIVDHGVNGYKCNTADEMVRHIKQLLDDHILAKRMGAEARAKALQIYDPKSIRQQWQRVFKAIL